MRRLRIIALAAALLTSTVATALTAAAPAQAAPVICEKYGSASIQGGRYIVINNVWGADTTQCIDVNQNGGFTITQSAHNKPTNGAPAAYPAIYAGCHYGNCTSGSGLPMQASSPDFGRLRSSVNYTFASGTYNAAYDLWFDPTPRTDGQNTGAELMIWLNRQGGIQPIGSRVGTANLAGTTWEVWFGNTGWNVISYVRTSPATSIDFAIDTFYSDAVSRGYAQRNWYLTSVQAGFEPWVGGAGLAVNSFSYTTSGNIDPPQSPTPTPSRGGPSPSPSSGNGPGGGSCTVSYNAWSTGYVGNVTVNGPRSGWSFTVSLPSGHQFANGWNAQFSNGGQNVTASNMPYNGSLSAGQSTSWGFQATRPDGDTQLPNIPGCTRV